MDQQKAGRFLKELRHEKEMTQEQLAQVFNVSSRTISRWENGTNLPDISLLVEIADFYDVDVREIIEGERKSEMMDKEVRDVATKMAGSFHENSHCGRDDHWLLASDCIICNHWNFVCRLSLGAN
ncbi:Helix-turn-helix [Butyrivibrio sp. ob235]|uniref:helix-turn-helix domain-containing protein n=1 Tax=Butyrivibrio sp. ob235 TaxID=1761780 RepID=UPI0008C6DFBB|nr:helix-turn-helix transcriptional regulator [Butyrivibrio sp. ob235]SEM16349.1 Helix-turn-helix [Butyrivibrio sp. ob235]